MLLLELTSRINEWNQYYGAWLDSGSGKVYYVKDQYGHEDVLYRKILPEWKTDVSQFKYRGDGTRNKKMFDFAFSRGLVRLVFRNKEIKVEGEEFALADAYPYMVGTLLDPTVRYVMFDKRRNLQSVGSREFTSPGTDPTVRRKMQLYVFDDNAT